MEGVGASLLIDRAEARRICRFCSPRNSVVSPRRDDATGDSARLYPYEGVLGMSSCHFCFSSSTRFCMSAFQACLSCSNEALASSKAASAFSARCCKLSSLTFCSASSCWKLGTLDLASSNSSSFRLAFRVYPTLDGVYRDLFKYNVPLLVPSAVYQPPFLWRHPSPSRDS